MRNRQEGGLQNKDSLAEKIRKKYVPLTAIIAIGAGALAGCGSSEQAPENRAQSAQTAATAEATSSATPSADPSIKAPARNKTSQPERSRSTDKATEIPSFPASPTQSPEQQSAEELLPGEEKLTDEENQAFRKELDQALRDGSEINVGRGVFIIEKGEVSDQKGVSRYTAVSNPLVADVGKKVTDPVSPNAPKVYYVYDAKTEHWSQLDKEKIPNSFAVDRDGNEQPGLQLQRTQFWTEKKGSELRDDISTGTDGLKTPTGGDWTGVTEDIARSTNYSSSNRQKAADAAVESTTHHRSR